jgi:hypothetical protein
MANPEGNVSRGLRLITKPLVAVVPTASGEPRAIPMEADETGESEPKSSTTPNNSIVNRNALAITRFA